MHCSCSLFTTVGILYTSILNECIDIDLDFKVIGILL